MNQVGFKRLSTVLAPTDMQTAYERTNPWGKELFQTFLGGTPEESPAAYQTASPTTYVTKDDPPRADNSRRQG